MYRIILVSKWKINGSNNNYYFIIFIKLMYLVIVFIVVNIRKRKIIK